MHAVTQQVKDQVDNMLAKKKAELSPEQESMLQSKYDEIDEWMDHKPAWVEDDKITAKVTGLKDSKSGSMLD